MASLLDLAEIPKPVLKPTELTPPPVAPEAPSSLVDLAEVKKPVAPPPPPKSLMDLSEVKPTEESPTQGPWPGKVTLPPEQRGIFGRGLTTGMYGMKETGLVLKAMAQNVLGDPNGARDTMDLAQILDNKSQALAPKYNTIQDVWKNGSVGDWINFAAYNLGQQIPNLATTAATGGIGAFVGKSIADAYAKKLITQEMRDQLIAKFVKRGAVAGAFLSTAGMETAGTAQEQYQSTGRFNTPVALTAGSIKGVLEELTPLALASRLGLPKTFASGLLDAVTGQVSKRLGGGFLARRVGGAVGTGLEEFTTEGLQEAVDVAARAYVDKNYDALGPDARARILNSAATGGLVGAILGVPLGHAGAEHAQAGTTLPVQGTGQGTAPVGPGSTTGIQIGSTPGIVTPPGPGTAGITVPTGPDIPSLGDLPKQVAKVSETTPGLVITKESLKHVQEAVRQYNTVQRLQKANAPEASIKRAQGRATAALNNAIQNGFRLAPKETVTPPGPPGPPGPPTPPGPVTPKGPPGPGTFRPGESPQEHISQYAGQIQPLSTEEQGRLPAIEKFIPQHANPTIEAIQQGIRNSIAQEGGVDMMPPAVREGLRLPSEQQKMFASMQAMVEHQLNEYFQDRVPGFEVANLDIKNGTIKVQTRDTNGVVHLDEVPTDPKVITYLTEKTALIRRQAGLPVYDYKALYPKGKFLTPTFQAMQTQSLGTMTELGRVIPTVHGVDGKPLPIGAMQPGSVAQVPGAAVFNERELRFIQSLVRRVDPNAKIIIDGSTIPVTFPGHKDMGGYYHTFENGYSVIWINRTATRDRQIQTFFHEFGHFVVDRRFRQAGTATQTAIYNAWIRDSQGLKTPLDMAMHLRSPLYQVSLMQGLNRVSPEGWANWWNFDEYMAEQTAKFFLTNARPASLVDRFFVGVASKVKEVWNALAERFQVRGIKLEANEVVAGWLQDVILRSSTMQDPLGKNGMIDSQREGGIKNLPYSDMEDRLDPLTSSFEDLIAASPPDGPETERLSQAAVKLSLPGWPARRAGMDKFNRWIRLTWNLLQVAGANLHIEPLQRYTELMRSWAITRMEQISKADGILKEWRKLPGGPAMQQALSNFLFAIDSMEYLPAGQRARWPTQQELSALAQRYGLNREAGALYQRITTAFSEFLDQVEEAWTFDAMQIRDPIVQQRELNKITHEMTLMRRKPYFPHSRWGDYTLSVRDTQGRLVFYQQFEDQRAANNAVADARRQFPGHRVTTDVLPGEMRQFTGMPPSMLRSMQNKLGLTGRQLKIFEELIFDMSPANSFAKKFKKRSNIAGYSMDAQRAFASYFLHGAGHLARLKWSSQMQTAIDDTRLSRMTLPDTATAEKAKRQDIADWMERHYQYVMHPPNEYTWLRSLAFQWYLGFAPDSALLNLTQVPLVAAPYLSSRFGNLKIIPAFMSAGRDLRKLYDDPGNSRLPVDESGAMGEGVKQGFLDEAQASELAAASEGGNTMTKLIPGKSIQRMIVQTAQWSSYLFQQAEKLNRKIVFITAYRLAKENPTTPHLSELVASNQLLVQDLLSQGWRPEAVQAFLAGRDAVEKTQFEYARWARPEFMRGKKGVFFTFYMYQQGMLHFFRNQPGGLKALTLLLFAAGLQGFPFEEDLNNIVRYVGEKLFGTRWDPNTELRKLLLELDLRPEIFMHGLGRESLGLKTVGDMLGIPMPSVDLSNRMGMGQIIPGVQAFTSESPSSFDERLGQVTEGVLGATIGIPLTIMKALEGGDLTQLRTYEQAVPRVFKNILQGYRYYMEGETTKTGAQLVPFDVTDSYGRWQMAIERGLGFVPTEIARKRELSGAQLDAYNYWAMRRQELMYQFGVARLAGDAETMTATRERIQYFNKTAPDPHLRITPQQLMQSVKQRFKSRVKIEQGRAPTGTLSGVARETQRLYPEAQTP